MYTTPWCGYCHRLGASWTARASPTTSSTSSSTPRPPRSSSSVNNGNQTVPTLVYADGTAQTNPSLVQVKEKLGQPLGLIARRSPGAGQRAAVPVPRPATG